MLRKLFSHTAIYGLAPQIPRVASVISLPIITPFLTENDFGVFGLITAVAGSIGVLATLGLNVILTNSFYKYPGQYKWLWRQIYGFLTLWNIPFAIFLAILLYLFIPKEASGNAWYIILLNVLPIVLFGPTAILGNLYYQLKQRPAMIATRAVITGLLAVGLNIYFIAVLKMGYMGWFLSICITTILSHASYWIPLNTHLKLKPIFNFKWRLIKQSLRVGVPTIPHSYSAYLLDSSDRVVMKVMSVTTGEIGLYNAAYMVGNFAQQIGVAAGKAVVPLMYNEYKKGDEVAARNLVFALQIVFLTCSTILCIWMKEVFYLMLKNPSLQGVYPLGIIIIMAYNYRPMYLGVVNKLFYLEKTTTLLKISFIAGVANLVLNIIFIPIYGYKAAAYTTFFALMYMGYSGYLLKDLRRALKVGYRPVIWLTLTFLLTIASSFAVEFDRGMKIGLSIAGLTIGLFCIRRLPFKHT